MHTNDYVWNLVWSCILVILNTSLASHRRTSKFKARENCFLRKTKLNYFHKTTSSNVFCPEKLGYRHTKLETLTSCQWAPTCRGKGGTCPLAMLYSFFVSAVTIKTCVRPVFWGQLPPPPGMLLSVCPLAVIQSAPAVFWELRLKRSSTFFQEKSAPDFKTWGDFS